MKCKKIIAFVLSIMMLLSSVSALADADPVQLPFTVPILKAALNSAVSTQPNYDVYNDHYSELIQQGQFTVFIRALDYTTGNPIPYIDVGLNYLCGVAGYTTGVTQFHLASGTTDSNGMAMMKLSITGMGYDSSKAAYYGTLTGTYQGVTKSVKAITQSIGGGLGGYFDCDPVTAGYSYDVSVAGRVRNYITGHHMGKYPKGTHDDALIGTGLFNTAAAVTGGTGMLVFDIYLKNTGNTGSHTVSFNTSDFADAAGAYASTYTVANGNTLRATMGSLPTGDIYSKTGAKLLGWTCNGIEYDFDTAVNQNMVLQPRWQTQKTISFDTTTILNPGTTYNTIYVLEGTSAAGLSPANPTHYKNSARPFQGWVDANGNDFDFSTAVITENVTLSPKWGANPNVAAYIHLDSYLWDHDDYNDRGGAYGSGQTTTPVRCLTYKIEYYDQARATSTEQWRLLKTVTVDTNGKADITLTAEDLQILSDFRDEISTRTDGTDPHRVAIDIGPDENSKGYHEPSERRLKYAWDWMSFSNVTAHGAGLTGVRTMLVNDDNDPVYDNDRTNNNWRMGKGGDSTTPTVGNVLYAQNQNHVPWLTQDMLDNGFEIWWNCYVAPAMSVDFELNGGEGTGDYSQQVKKPINSLPDAESRSAFLVTRPTDPTKSGMEFVGWYKVLNHGTASETLESTPWDFGTRLVTESMVLRAVYTNKKYTVTFDPANGSALESGTYIVGNTPMWTGETPSKASDGKYTYAFTNWKETTGSHLNNTYTLNGEYSFDNQVRTISGSGFDPVTVDDTFAATTVYTAQYSATPIDYTITYVLDGGSWSDTNTQSYNCETNVTLKGTPTREHYDFAGWKVTIAAGNWTLNSTYAAAANKGTGNYGNVTLTAQWTPRYNYKITFHENAGSDTVTGMPSDMSETGWILDSSKTYSWTSNPTRANFDFDGWAESASGSVVITGTSATLTGVAATLVSKDYYAKWKPKQYTVTATTVAGDTGCNNPTGSGTYAFNAQVTVNANVKPGYDFVAWYKDAAATNVASVNSVYSFDMPGQDVYLYAKTSEQQVTYNYVPVFKTAGVTGYGSVSVTTETVGKVTGSPSSTATAVTPTFKFVGWYSDANCQNQLSTDATYAPNNRDGNNLLLGGTYYALFEYNQANYTVKHWLQNADDAEYTEDTGAKETKTGTIGEQTAAAAKDTYTDYEAQSFDQVTITADGNAVVNIYYNRKTASLTITKSGMSAGESAIFNVIAGGKTFKVSVAGNNGSAVITGLKIGSAYSVTEASDWSWRYNGNGTNATGTIASAGSTAAFTNTPKDSQKWLDDEARAENKLK